MQGQLSRVGFMDDFPSPGIIPTSAQTFRFLAVRSSFCV